jgi:hypothetical protein
MAVSVRSLTMVDDSQAQRKGGRNARRQHNINRTDRHCFRVHVVRDRLHDLRIRAALHAHRLPPRHALRTARLRQRSETRQSRKRSEGVRRALQRTPGWQEERPASTAIAVEAKEAGLPASIELPTANIAGKAITNGALGRDFAACIPIHTLESTGGLAYAEMGRFQALPTAPANMTDGLGGTSELHRRAALGVRHRRRRRAPARRIRLRHPRDRRRASEPGDSTGGSSRSPRPMGPQRRARPRPSPRPQRSTDVRAAAKRPSPRGPRTRSRPAPSSRE